MSTAVAPVDEALPLTLTPIAIRLADEGIPVRCIARGLKQPSELVREALEEARQRGAITEMPRDDWPPTARKTDHVPTGHAAQKAEVAEEDMLLTCIRVFKVTQLQSCVLGVLLRREEASKTTIHNAIENQRATRRHCQPVDLEETDPKLVDVVICLLRKRLKPFGIVIKTLWARGYCIERADRAKAMEIIKNHDNPPPAAE